MKKLILVIIFMFSLVLPLISKNKGCGFYGEFGKCINNNIAYTDIEIHYIFKFWQIELMPYGGTKTWYISDINITKGKPFCDIYKMGISVKYKNIIFYYEHYCAHPVASFHKKENEKIVWQIEDYQMGNTSDKFVIRYSFN